MSALPEFKFEIEIPPRLALPMGTNHVSESTRSSYCAQTGEVTTHPITSVIRFFDDGSYTLEMSCKSDKPDNPNTAIVYGHPSSGCAVEPLAAYEPFSSRIAYNIDPDAGVVGQVLDMRDL